MMKFLCVTQDHLKLRNKQTSEFGMILVTTLNSDTIFSISLERKCAEKKIPVLLDFGTSPEFFSTLSSGREGWLENKELLPSPPTVSYWIKSEELFFTIPREWKAYSWNIACMPSSPTQVNRKELFRTSGKPSWNQLHPNINWQQEKQRRSGDS